MSIILDVLYLYTDDCFVAGDRDTGKKEKFDSSIFLTSDFPYKSDILRHMLAAFPGKTECRVSTAALDRISQIEDFNALNDEVQF